MCVHICQDLGFIHWAYWCMCFMVIVWWCACFTVVTLCCSIYIMSLSMGHFIWLSILLPHPNKYVMKWNRLPYQMTKSMISLLTSVKCFPLQMGHTLLVVVLSSKEIQCGPWRKSLNWDEHLQGLWTDSIDMYGTEKETTRCLHSNWAPY